MNTKTIVTAAILATMGVENSLKHERSNPHTHIESVPPVHKTVIGIATVSGIKITLYSDNSRSYDYGD